MSLLERARAGRMAPLRGGGHPDISGHRWLMPYADIITLLLALFVILFAMTSVDRVKMQALVHDISGGFNNAEAINNPPNGGTTGSRTGDGVRDSQLNHIEAALQSFVRRNNLAAQVTTRFDRRGLVISLLADDALYSSGSAELAPKTRRLLDEIVAVLASSDRHVRVEGNTDNVPIRTSEYPTNWELSAARATGVTRYLVEDRHLSPMRVSLAGYGEFRPLTDNTTAAHRRRNRRVDIVILSAAATTADRAVQP